MREYNEVMNKYYDPEKCVFFENALQSNAYIFRGNAELQAVLDSKRNPDALYSHSLSVIISDLEKNGKITNYR